MNASTLEQLRTNHRRLSSQGLSIRAIHGAMALVTLVISAVLLVTTFRANAGYAVMRENTEDYIRWERDANELQIASDYLTEQVRCFAETGDRGFLDNYFTEANVTRRRDRALDSIRSYEGGEETFAALCRAMAQSLMLMQREYYSMRLTVEAYGFDLEEFPPEVRAVELKPEDAALAAAEKEALARAMVFDEEYHAEKAVITENVRGCLDELAKAVEERQRTTADALHTLLEKQRVLIIALIVLTLLTMLTTLLLVISPLLKAVFYIRAEQPIPIRGSYEFQFLAKTYNLMYEANREEKEHLAYEATHDALTGAYNRSGYDFLMSNLELDTVALLIFDLDDFKGINDRSGHDAGDRALKRTAEVIRASFRSQDYLCRIGGDEFTVIMMHVTRKAAPLIERKVAEINRMLAEPTDALPALSVSCGAAFGSQQQDGAELFRQADAALYSVKRKGGSGCAIGE